MADAKENKRNYSEESAIDFDKRCIAARVSLWFLMTVFENPDFEDRLRSAWETSKDNKEIVLMLLSHSVIDALVDMYLKQEAEEAAEHESEEEA